jgi:hypothetical protein
MTAMGEHVSYPYLMGVSAAAFRLQVMRPQCCASSPHAQIGHNCTDPAMAALGYPLTWMDTRDAAGDRDTATEALVASIDAGRPALLSSEECGLIVGYVDDGEQFLVRPYSAEFTQQKEGYVPMATWPWEVGIIGPKAAPPPRRESVIGSLRTAVALANTPNVGDYACGFAAFEAWAEQLMDDARYVGLDRDTWFNFALGNGFTYGCLSDARMAAGRYLRSIIPDFDGEAATLLTRAAEMYENIYNHMWIERDDLPKPWWLLPWDLKEPENWTNDMRHAQARVLGELLVMEQQAIAEIERALVLLE